MTHLLRAYGRFGICGSVMRRSRFNIDRIMYNPCQPFLCIGHVKEARQVLIAARHGGPPG
jgi:hypothetical protein